MEIERSELNDQQIIVISFNEDVISEASNMNGNIGHACTYD